MRSSRLTSAAFWLLLVLLVLAWVGVGYVALYLLKDRGGVPGEAWRILVTQPMNVDRVISILAIALIPTALTLTPIAIAEARSLKRYHREEARLRLMWPHATVTPYESDEESGLAFDVPELRILLLHPAAGVGSPRIVNLPPPPPPPAQGLPPEGGEPDRTSPMGS